MAFGKPIDPEKLREVASNPKFKIADICRELGIADPTLYQQLGRHPELKAIFTAARTAAKAARGEQSQSARAPRRKYKQRAGKAKSANTPPRNGHSKANYQELFKKLLHEFEHIDIYGATSEHFDELRAEVSTFA